MRLPPRFSICRSPLMTSIIISLTLISDCWAWQNNKKEKGAVDREQQDVRQAEQRLREARNQAEEAKRAVANATGGQKRAADHVREMQEKVEREHDQAPALVAAHRQSDRSRGEFEAARAELLKTLAVKPDYQAAVEARELAKQKLAALSPTAAPTEREALAKQFQQAGDLVRGIEKAAIAADPATSRAEAAYQKDMAEFRTLDARRDQAVENDSRVSKAKAELRQAKEHLEQAKNKLGKELADIERAEGQLRAQQQQRKQAEERLRDSKNKNNKNNNKKKK